MQVSYIIFAKLEDKEFNKFVKMDRGNTIADVNLPCHI